MTKNELDGGQVFVIDDFLVLRGMRRVDPA